MHLVTKFSLQSFVQFDQRHERKNVNRDILTNVLHILEDGIPSIDRSFELKKKKRESIDSNGARTMTRRCRIVARGRKNGGQSELASPRAGN